MILTNYLMNYDVDWTSWIIEKKNGTSYALARDSTIYWSTTCMPTTADSTRSQGGSSRERGGHPISCTTPLQSY